MPTDQKAREAAMAASIESLSDYKMMLNAHARTAARIAVPAAIDAYLSVLATELPEKVKEIAVRNAAEIKYYSDSDHDPRFHTRQLQAHYDRGHLLAALSTERARITKMARDRATDIEDLVDVGGAIELRRLADKIEGGF